MENTKPFRWSFSQWETYNSCPAKWKYRYVDKLPGLPAGPAAARGTMIHAGIEEYIIGQAERLPEEVHINHTPLMRRLREVYEAQAGVTVELKLGMTYADWRVVKPDDPEASCITIFDGLHADGVTQEMDVWEWKSGKPKDTHKQQRELYSLAAMQMVEGTTQVTAKTVYVEAAKQRPQDTFTLYPDDVPALKKVWEIRRDDMVRDEMCSPKPSFMCRWCDFAKDKGGPCMFSGVKEVPSGD